MRSRRSDAMAGMPDKSEAARGGGGRAIARARRGTAAGAEKAKAEAGISPTSCSVPSATPAAASRPNDGPEGKSAAAFGDPNSVYRGARSRSLAHRPQHLRAGAWHPARSLHCIRARRVARGSRRRSRSTRRGRSSSASARPARRGSFRRHGPRQERRRTRPCASTPRGQGGRPGSAHRRGEDPHRRPRGLRPRAPSRHRRQRARRSSSPRAPTLTAKDTIPGPRRSGRRRRAWPRSRPRSSPPPTAERARPTRSINAAIARSIAGADDEKSPRAPGQLDALLGIRTSTPTASPSRRGPRSRPQTAAPVLPRAQRGGEGERSGDDRVRRSPSRRDAPRVRHARLGHGSFCGAKLDQKTDPEALSSLRTSRRGRSLRRGARPRRGDLAAAFRCAGRTRSQTSLVYELARRPKARPRLVLQASELFEASRIRGGVLVDRWHEGQGTTSDGGEGRCEGGMAEARERSDDAMTSSRPAVPTPQLYRHDCALGPNRAAGPPRRRGHGRWAQRSSEAQTVLVALRRRTPGALLPRAPPGSLRAAKTARRAPTRRARRREVRGDPRARARRAARPTSRIAELHWPRVVRMHPINRDRSSSSTRARS